MLTTTHVDFQPTECPSGEASPSGGENELSARYREISAARRHTWTTHHHLRRMLGKGGQGIVYLSERRGADSFTLPIAVKFFSPERFFDARAYEEAMARNARVAAKVATIQQDNLLDVHNFLDLSRIRMMEMEWVDGFDLSRLLQNNLLEKIRSQVSASKWEHICGVILGPGPGQARVKPGVAVAIVRDCLAALAALHREGIVHGDIKPSNIMLKRLGTAKIVDIGSAHEIDDPPRHRTVTPAYAAPEVLEGHEATPRSDLASLGYVLVEMLSGNPPFAGCTNYKEYLEAKRLLAQRLPHIMPHEVTCSDVLMNLCRGMVAPDPLRRFPSADHADYSPKGGASAFHRQLVIGDLACEYDNEIRLWLETLKDIEEELGSPPTTY